jgi:hypothetical protein
MARKRFNFWLDDRRPSDWELKDAIDELKRDRLFSRAIREGLKMWIESQAELPAPVTASPSDGGAGQLDEIKAMLELIVTQQKNGNGYLMQSISTPTTGKQLGGFKALAPPVEDDDLPTIAISKSKNESSALNFVTALKSMQF